MASEIVTAEVVWSADRNILRLLAAERSRQGFLPEDVDDVPGLYVIWGVDDHERETGQVVGVEIHDFLAFNAWERLPSLGMRWRRPGDKPSSLSMILQQVQRQLRQHMVGASSR